MTRLIRKLGLFFQRDRFRRELSEEMAFHRAQAESRFEADGMSPEAARTAARRQFGNETLLRERSHEAVGFRFESIVQDVRYAIRQMLRSPGFTLAVVLTLALGVGANTAIFSVVQATLLRPLPYPDANALMRIKDVRRNGATATGGLVGVPRFYDLQERSKSFESLAFFCYESPTMVIDTRLPEQLEGSCVTGQFWHVLGVQPFLGRVFDEREDRPHTGEVVVLSYAAWQRLFGGDTTVIGKAVTLDKQSATIVGVMPRGFSYPARIDMWRPTHFDPAGWKQYRGDGVRFANVIGRLKPGIRATTASNELDTIAAQLTTEHGDTDAAWQFSSMPLRDDLYGQLRPALLVLMAASTALLLIACVNVANLLFARATARRREVALRQALGASQSRIMRQLFTESLLLAFVGGAFGLAAAFALVRVAGSRLHGALGTLGGISLDWPVVGFALAVSMCAGIVFGVAPILESRRANLNRSLKAGEARTSMAGGRARSIFIAVQVGLSLILLIGASLLTESLWKLTRTPLGFNPEKLLTFSVELPWNGSNGRADSFFAEVERRIEALPGITAVGQISAPPTVDWHARTSFDADWRPGTTHHDAVSVEERVIAGEYARAMGIPLLAGRLLRDKDPAAVMVNQEFVRKYLYGGDPVGHQLTDTKGHNFQIVGVLGNVRGTAGSLSGEVQPELYYPADGLTARWFVVRSKIPPEQTFPAIRAAVQRVDPQQAIGNAQSIDEMLSLSVAQPRLNMALLVGFAVIALILACVGIYGVVAYSVAQRRQEIGVRMALGATRAQVVRLFLGRSAIAAAFGLAGGSVAALMLVRLLRSQLYGISPYDAPTFVAAIFLLTLPVLLASLRPALRAASVNPVEALRAE